MHVAHMQTNLSFRLLKHSRKEDVIFMTLCMNSRM